MKGEEGHAIKKEIDGTVKECACSECSSEFKQDGKEDMMEGEECRRRDGDDTQRGKKQKEK